MTRCKLSVRSRPNAADKQKQDRLPARACVRACEPTWGRRIAFTRVWQESSIQTFGPVRLPASAVSLLTNGLLAMSPTASHQTFEFLPGRQEEHGSILGRHKPAGMRIAPSRRICCAAPQCAQHHEAEYGVDSVVASVAFWQRIGALSSSASVGRRTQDLPSAGEDQMAQRNQRGKPLSQPVNIEARKVSVQTPAAPAAATMMVMSTAAWTEVAPSRHTTQRSGLGRTVRRCSLISTCTW